MINQIIDMVVDGKVKSFNFFNALFVESIWHIKFLNRLNAFL
jgi:hypothetical protein